MARKIPLKTKKSQRNLAFFGEKFWKSILSQGEFINTLWGAGKFGGPSFEAPKRGQQSLKLPKGGLKCFKAQGGGSKKFEHSYISKNPGARPRTPVGSSNVLRLFFILIFLFEYFC